MPLRRKTFCFGLYVPWTVPHASREPPTIPASSLPSKFSPSYSVLLDMKWSHSCYNRDGCPSVRRHESIRLWRAYYNKIVCSMHVLEGQVRATASSRSLIFLAARPAKWNSTRLRFAMHPWSRTGVRSRHLTLFSRTNARFLYT